MELRISNPVSLTSVISNYDILFVGPYFSISVDWHIPQNCRLFIFYNSFWFVFIPYGLQMLLCYNSGKPSNGYVMMRYHVFECIQTWPVLDIQI